jgi:hypothetical protein
MAAARRGSIMLFMPASTDLTRRVLIPVAGPTAAQAKTPHVRHFRLARVPSQPRSEPTLDRFAHLRRSYD